MKRPQFVTNSFYHLYNRGVEKRDIFLEESDYLRFIRGLYEFNNNQPVALSKFPTTFRGRSSEYELNRKRNKKKVVEILCFCLMPNHFHIIVKQVEDGGISLFMKKLGTGYAMYFNTKRERTGTLFQGRYKAILIESDEYLLHLSRYIHLNPLSLIKSGWKEDTIRDEGAFMKFLETYRWSSYIDFIGKKNFSSITEGARDLILDMIGSPSAYRNFTKDWIKTDFQRIEQFVIDDSYRGRSSEN